MIWLIVTASLVILFVFIAITKVTVKTTYRHHQDDDLLDVHVSLWWMRVYTFSAPLIQLDDNSASLVVEEEQKIGKKKTKKTGKITVQTIVDDLQLFNRFLQHVVGFHNILRRFLKRVSVHNFEWRTEVGVGNAAYSAELAGAVWTLKGSIIGLVGNYMKMKQMPKLNVQPHFQENISRTYFSCMISFRIGHAIVAGLMLIRHWKRRPTLSRSNSVEENM